MSGTVAIVGKSSAGDVQIAADTNGNQLVASSGRLISTATIANGAALSPAVDLGVNMRASRITMPAAWTAADLTFQVSADGVTYNEMLDSLQTAVDYAVSASQDFALDPALWEGVRYVKVRSGTSGSPVNQGAARSIVFATVPV